MAAWASVSTTVVRVSASVPLRRSSTGAASVASRPRGSAPGASEGANRSPSTPERDERAQDAAISGRGAGAAELLAVPTRAPWLWRDDVHEATTARPSVPGRVPERDTARHV